MPEDFLKLPCFEYIPVEKAKYLGIPKESIVAVICKTRVDLQRAFKVLEENGFQSYWKKYFNYDYFIFPQEYIVDGAAISYDDVTLPNFIIIRQHIVNE